MHRLYVAWPISGYFELRQPIGRKDWTECRLNSTVSTKLTIFLSLPVCRQDKRHGSTIEYQALTSLHDLPYDGWLGIFTTYITAAGNSISSQPGQPLSEQPVRYGKDMRYDPSITDKITPDGSSPATSQPGHRDGPAL
jgi:hypothetical protein